MRTGFMLRIVILGLLLSALALSCGGPDGGEIPEGEPPGKGSCGDGFCDGPENPENCPADCGESGNIDDRPAAGSGWSADVTWSCNIDAGPVNNNWQVAIKYTFSVGPDGSISGSGQGSEIQAGCAQPDCDCSLDIEPFSVSVSGVQQGENFIIEMRPSYVMMQSNTCQGKTIDLQVHQMDGCHCGADGPLQVTIPVQDRAGASFNCNPDTGAGSVGTASGAVELHAE